MAHNFIKRYSDLLEINQYSEAQRKASLTAIFLRDIQDNNNFKFKAKLVRPTKGIDGEASLETLYHHLTTSTDYDEKGNKLTSRSFEYNRSVRLHWIKHHLMNLQNLNIRIFSYLDRVKHKDVIRTYLYNPDEKYVIILEPHRSLLDYYLLSAYYVDTKQGKNQMKIKQKNQLPQVY